MKGPVTLGTAAVLPGVTLVRSGMPLATGAVVTQPTAQLEPTTQIPRCTLVRDGDWTKLFFELTPDDRVFGLGENLGSLNRRGHRFRLFAKDEAHHTPDKFSLYGSHPFVIVDGAAPYAFFLDFPGEIFVDVGFARSDRMEVSFSSNDYDLYLFDGGPSDAVRNLLRLTGTPYFPPKWAFGYHQCRYSYPSAERVREIARGLREHRIPCDALYLDIEYMDRYKPFTVDRKAFPDLPALVQELREQGLRTVPILDPGIKIEPGCPLYEGGMREGVFCTDAKGEPFVGAVWPGLVHFPDFLSSKARDWWGKLFERFTSIGMSGFWNDMNEPAIFYTPRAVQELRARAEAADDDLGPRALEFIAKLGEFWGSERVYEEFYHTLDDGRRIRHREVHNLYGNGMARATAEGVAALLPGRRYFLVARSTYIGAHRYCVLWTGDSHSWWEHLRVEMQMMMSLSLCGFFFVGGDVGGFGGDANPELMIRWMQLGALSPFFRNHTTKGSRDQEPWAFGDEALAAMRAAIELRYVLMPYIYSEFRRSLEELHPFVAPLFLGFSGRRAAETEDQFMFGGSIMAAPVYLPNARGRHVHLPEGRWLLWRAADATQRSMTVMEPGEHWVECPLSEMLLFLRENRLVVLGAVAASTEQIDPQDLTVAGLVTDSAAFRYYDDDGESTGFANGMSASLDISVRLGSGGYVVETTVTEHPALRNRVRTLHFELYDAQGNLHRFDHALPTSAEQSRYTS